MLKSILLVLALSVTAGAQVPNFLTVEQQTRQALNQHTFKRDVTLQTVGPNNEVTGEYIRKSLFTFSDKGERVERILWESKNTITEMKITKEDFQDLADAQMLGVDDVNKYNIEQVADGSVEPTSRPEIVTFIPAEYSITPRVAPDPRRMNDRYFRGTIWTDSKGQIVRVRGVVEPSGKQRFPWFNTSRGYVGAPYPFPISTTADDVLHFPAKDVHYRISVRYYDYKRFGSTVEIKELEPVPAMSTRVDRGSPVLALPRYATGSPIKVYITPDQFTVPQIEAIKRAMSNWARTGQVAFEFIGEPTPWCLTILRKDIVSEDRTHFAYFRGLTVDKDVVGGSIELDVRTTDPKAVESFVAHELGHAIGGLSDCEKCDSVMMGFPSPNKGNGHCGPTEIDLRATRGKE